MRRRAVRRWGIVCAALLALAIPGPGFRAPAAETVGPSPGPGTRPAVPGARSYEETYEGYKPDFVERDAALWAKKGRDDPLKLSYQKRFFNMSVVAEDSRVDALIAAGRKKEEQREFRDAVEIYRLVIDNYPHILFRVAEHGIFVPARTYCQRRILAFPERELQFYRTLYDAPARDAFERARRRYSLMDLREVVNSMRATSYGDNALFELGNAALDIGNFEEALSCYRQVRDEFPDTDVDGEELLLKIAYCRKALALAEQVSGAGAEGNPKPGAPGAGEGQPPASRLTPDQRQRLAAAIAKIEVSRPPFHRQQAAPPHDSVADYTLYPPTDDPLSLKPSVWEVPLPVASRDLSVFFYPVATEDSLIYRHKNIVYCRSLLSGGLRWKNDLGGRVVWRNLADAFFPSEEVLIQDGLVFTNMYKSGASLVALDEVTGRLRWAHGPIAPVTEEDSRTSYFACPAGGRRTIYASYVIDNIEGQTHLDTVYGVRAFDATTGRIQWSRELCRLNVGKFMLSELITIRNRIRSYSTPPVLHEGTLYCISNAGVMAALEASTGSIKWLTRYPYMRQIHDRTRALRFRHNREGIGIAELVVPLWYNQRPLMLGDRLYVLPVDADYILCVDRTTGRILWSRQKGMVVDRRLRGGREAYLVGAVPADLAEEKPAAAPPEGPSPGPDVRHYLVVVYSGPSDAVHLLDADTGEAIWKGTGLFKSVTQSKHPILLLGPYWWGWGPVWGTTNARPFLTTDGKLHIPRMNRWPTYAARYGYGSMTPERSIYWVIDLKTRKTVARRLHYDGQYLALADGMIRTLQREYEDVMKNFPDRKPEPEWTERILRFKDEEVPVNDDPPFYPFSRMTFRRQGVQFELFVEPRVLKMKYDRSALEQALAAAR